MTETVEVLFVALKQLLEEDLVETPAPFLFVPFKGTEIDENLKRHGIEIVSNKTDEWHFFPIQSHRINKIR